MQDASEEPVFVALKEAGLVACRVDAGKTSWQLSVAGLSRVRTVQPLALGMQLFQRRVDLPLVDLTAFEQCTMLFDRGRKWLCGK